MTSRHSPRPARRPLALLCSAAAMFIMAGCADNPMGPPADFPLAVQAAVLTPTVTPPEPEKVFVCKEGPAGTYNFTARVTSGAITGAVGSTQVPVLLHDAADGTVDGQSAFSVNAGACLQIVLLGGASRTIEVTELAHAGTEFVETTILQLAGGVVTTTTGGNPASGKASGTPEEGATIVFKNREIVLEPSLSITKVADNSSVSAGTNIGFGITVSSNGPGTATGVTLSDPLPTGSGISWTIDTQPASNPCSIVSGTLTCNFGDLAAGTSVTVHISSPTTAASCATYTNTATADGSNLDPITATATTTVECEETGFEGCTPGFWKQKQHFQFWTSPYTTTTKINTVFANTGGYFTNKTNLPVGDQTLLQGLNFKGGETLGGAVEILLRAAIAGLLNAASPDVDYAQSEAALISAVNSALASQDRGTILGLAGTIDWDNNQLCTAKD